MNVLISYSFSAGQISGFGDATFTAPDGKVTSAFISEFREAAKRNHGAQSVVILNIIRLDD